MYMTSRPYDACIFDLDGTLANTLASIAHFGNATLEEFGLPPIPTERYKQLVGNGADVLMERMLQTVGPSCPRRGAGNSAGPTTAATKESP